MPSIRVRRSTYFPLTEPVIGPSQPRSLAPLFVSQYPPDTQVAPDPQPLLNVPGPADVSPSSISGPQVPVDAQPSPRRRPRALSRVDQHCQSTASSIPKRTWQGEDQDAEERRSALEVQRKSSRQSTQRLEGKDKSEGPLRETFTHEGTQPSDDLEDIHDNVIEHLDCIDPEVATVSNLTNAANAILFPPLYIYSRKPIVVLLHPGYDTERGGLEDPLDRHVVNLLNKPARFKRTMRGIWSFLKTPLGIVAGIYGFLVVFWGAALVFFLAKFINLHNANTQGFWVEVCSQILNGLFTVTGLGLLPSRVLDTYRVCKIWHCKRKTSKLRAKAGLPQLYDVDDLPDPAYDPNYVHVLTDEEQVDLHKQQRKFQRSQTWYRPHGTETHRAFPINTALLICCFIDGNSFFQILLCGVMWGFNRFQRPPWTTGSLVPLSFLCGIISAILIWRGGQKTKRTQEVREKLMAVLRIRVPHGNRDAPVDIGIVPEAPVDHPGRLESVDRDEMTAANGGYHVDDPDIEKRTEIVDSMTIPASSVTH